MNRTGKNPRKPLYAALLALAAAPSAQAQLLGNNGTLNTNVINTPNVIVANPAATPAAVHDFSQPTRTPVSFQVGVGMSFGTQRFGCGDYTVPAGKRLEIDHVSASSQVLVSGNTIKATYTTHSGGDIGVFYLDLHNQNYSSTEPLYIADQAQLAFADPGTTVELCATLKTVQGSGGGGFAAIYATFTGYLVSP